MKAIELKKLVDGGALSKYSDIYCDIKKQTDRISVLLDSFVKVFGDGETRIFSVPGRSEIIGNHTDHNGGMVIAAAVDKDAVSIAKPNDEGIIRVLSEGYKMESIRICDCSDPRNFDKYSSAALIAGVVDSFAKHGYNVGGFDAYVSSDVMPGSGISSSAAYEVSIGNILSGLYNGGSISAVELAKMAQYAENVYFGKPSGLMDQMACAVGGFVYIDFSSKDDPIVESMDFSLADEGYRLCIINTGGSHADLNDDYASVPEEMIGVARMLGKKRLADVSEEEIISSASSLRRSVGDRAILRALHFARENKRVTEARQAIAEKDVDRFLRVVTASGNSSFKYLQNVYTNKKVDEQGLSLALALADGYLDGRPGACRVHGGGFAGTVQVFVRDEDLGGLKALVRGVFGRGSVMVLNVRPKGAIEVKL